MATKRYATMAEYYDLPATCGHRRGDLEFMAYGRGVRCPVPTCGREYPTGTPIADLDDERCDFRGVPVETEPPSVPHVDLCQETAYGTTVRLPFQIRVF